MIAHHPRLAWDTAQAFVTACESGSHFVWLSGRVRDLLGAPVQRALAETRHRLVRPTRLDARHVEARTWQAQVDELLQGQPELGTPLQALVTEATAKLARPLPYWPVN